MNSRTVTRETGRCSGAFRTPRHNRGVETNILSGGVWLRTAAPDILHVDRTVVSANRAVATTRWWCSQFRENTSYDEFASAIVAARVLLHCCPVRVKFDSIEATLGELKR